MAPPLSALSALPALDGPRATERGLLTRMPAGVLVPALGVVGAVLTGAAVGLRPVYGVGMALAVVLGMVLLRHPLLGALLVVAVVPVLPGVRRGVPVPGLRLSETLVVVVAVAALLLGDRRSAVRWTIVDWSLFAYVAATIGLGSFNLLRLGEPFTFDAIGTMTGPVQYLLLLRVVVTYFVTPERRRLAVRLVLLASVPIALIGIAQQFGVPGVLPFISAVIDRAEVFQGWEYTRQARVTSLFPHWHPLAGYLALVVLVGVSLVLGRGQRVFPRWAVGLVLAPVLLALVFTATLASIFGAVSGIVLLGILHGRMAAAFRWLLVAAVLAAVLAGPYLGQRIENQFGDSGGAPQGIEFRVAVWTEQYVPAISGRLTTGHGPDLPPEIAWRHTENQYVTLLLRGGIPLLATLLVTLGAVAAAATRAARGPDPERQAVARAVLATVVVLVPMMAIYPYLTSTGLTHLLWVLVGLVLAPTRPVPHRHVVDVDVVAAEAEAGAGQSSASTPV